MRECLPNHQTGISFQFFFRIIDIGHRFNCYSHDSAENVSPENLAVAFFRSFRIPLASFLVSRCSISPSMRVLGHDSRRRKHVTRLLKFVWHTRHKFPAEQKRWSDRQTGRQTDERTDTLSYGVTNSIQTHSIEWLKWTLGVVTLP